MEGDHQLHLEEVDLFTRDIQWEEVDHQRDLRWEEVECQREGRECPCQYPKCKYKKGLIHRKIYSHVDHFT